MYPRILKRGLVPLGIFALYGYLSLNVIPAAFKFMPVRVRESRALVFMGMTLEVLLGTRFRGYDDLFWCLCPLGAYLVLVC